MPIFWMAGLAGIAIAGLVGAYWLLPHVTKRIDQFLDPSAGNPVHDLYQITKSLAAFANGGFFGKISNLVYFRYAMKPDEVYKIYASGPY